MATATVSKPPGRETASDPVSLHPSTPVAVLGNQGPRIVRAVTIRRPAAELYAFWRDVKNLQLVIKDHVSITATSANESHWKVTALSGTVEWDSLIINDEPDALIVWRSREGADVP
ncbi:MAG: cyclase, partial [Burkholderiales bacterium]|nr:cyclase [Opitutaceae bacterium]